MTARDLRIETLRGLACVLLVAHHAIGDSERGLRLPDDSSLRWLSDTFIYLRMPLFTFLSGYVYAMRPPATWQDATPFFRGKIRRLLLPLLCVGLLYKELQSIIPSVNVAQNETLLHYFIYTQEHFWYLRALFLIFIFIYLADAIKAATTPRGLLVMTLLAFALLSHLRIPSDPFSFNGATYLLPYFLLGVLLRRHEQEHGRLSLPPAALAVLVTVVLLMVTWQQADLAGWQVPDMQPPHLPLGQLYSALSILLLYAIGISSRWLAWIGGYSYSIYLFHVFGTAGSRIALTRIGIDDTATLFVGTMLAGVLLPILAEHVLDRWPITRTTMLGRAWRSKTTGTSRSSD